MNEVIQRTNGLAVLDNLPEKKQKQVIITEVQNITSEVLKCFDKADTRKAEIKELTRLIRESDQCKKLSKLRKEFKELNSTAHALLMELRGIRRLVKKVNPDLLPVLTQIKELSQN